LLVPAGAWGWSAAGREVGEEGWPVALVGSVQDAEEPNQWDQIADHRPRGQRHGGEDGNGLQDADRSGHGGENGGVEVHGERSWCRVGCLDDRGAERAQVFGDCPLASRAAGAPPVSSVYADDTTDTP